MTKVAQITVTQNKELERTRSTQNGVGPRRSIQCSTLIEVATNRFGRGNRSGTCSLLGLRAARSSTQVQGFIVSARVAGSSAQAKGVVFGVRGGRQSPASGKAPWLGRERFSWFQEEEAVDLGQGFTLRPPGGSRQHASLRIDQPRR